MSWELFCSLFVLLLGGIVGSFLNVVVYRLPRGMSLVRPASRCPHCETPIRPWHNVPVVGWLWLRGRCHACGQAIAGRYPLVELASALGFLGLAWCGPLSGGACWPARALSDQQLWLAMAYQTALVAVLWTMALVEFDGQRWPGRWTGWLLAAAVLAGVAEPALHLVSPPLATLADSLDDAPTTVAWLDGLAGLLVGATLGALAALASGESLLGAAGRWSALGALALVGAVLGWQAAVGIATCAALLFLGVVMFRNAWRPLWRVAYVGCVALATTSWIPAWRTAVDIGPAIGSAADHGTLAVGGLAVLLLSGIAWLFRYRPPDVSEPHG